MADNVVGMLRTAEEAELRYLRATRSRFALWAISIAQCLRQVPPEFFHPIPRMAVSVFDQLLEVFNVVEEVFVPVFVRHALHLVQECRRIGKAKGDRVFQREGVRNVRTI